MTTESTPLKKSYRPLPQPRVGKTYEVRVGGQALQLRTGEYADGGLGEICVFLPKADDGMRSVMDCWSKSISVGLQWGVSLEQYVNTFQGFRSAPSGRVLDDPDINFATSMVDYVVRRVGIDYAGRTDLANKRELTDTVQDQQR